MENCKCDDRQKITENVKVKQIEIEIGGKQKYVEICEQGQITGVWSIPLMSDRLRHPHPPTSVLILALVFRRARKRVDESERFGVKQAMKCERAVDLCE